MSLGIPCLSFSADPPNQFDARLATGEFARAIQEAKQLPSSEQRTNALQKIALAQAKAGGRALALETLRDVETTSGQTQGLLSIMQPGQSTSSTPVARGGGAQADFDSLIELITTTVHAESWDEVGGPGSIKEFAGGVYVAPDGYTRRIELDKTRSLEVFSNREWAKSALADSRSSDNVMRPSNLRYISLTRLEREVLFRRAAGLPVDDAMETLAGLRRIQYVMIYPETNELVIAGPAGPWHRDEENRIVSDVDNVPVVLLNDFITLWRREVTRRESEFGCTIEPAPENLVKAQQFLATTNLRLGKPAQRKKWLAGMQEAVGRQNIRYFGIADNSRVSRILFEADYRMKLIGMGLEESVPGVPSYLSQMPADHTDFDVLRWWFTLNYQALTTNESRSAFELHGPGIQVKSENELLDAKGNRVHTGKSADLNKTFASNFSKHIDLLSQKYPIYGELRNVFDLALVAALIESEGLSDRANWDGKVFLDDTVYPIEKATPAKEVDTVVNYHVIARPRSNQRQYVAGISGGVSVDMRNIVAKQKITVEPYDRAPTTREKAPAKLARDAWWWE